jgi:hypothetical protein
MNNIKFDTPNYNKILKINNKNNIYIDITNIMNKYINNIKNKMRLVPEIIDITNVTEKIKELEIFNFFKVKIKFKNNKNIFFFKINISPKKFIVYFDTNNYNINYKEIIV